MATTTSEPQKLGVLRFAATAALAAALFYVLCWGAARVIPSAPFTHMYLELFTATPAASSAALAQGVVWSVLVGLFGGGLIAASYNVLAFLDRR